MTGLLIVFSAPSGAGKNTIINQLIEQHPGEYVYSISATTRKPRGNEKHGEAYFFLSEKKFKAKIKQDHFVEWAEVHGRYYGTLRETVEPLLTAGKIVVFDLDVKGGQQVKKHFPKSSLLIFVTPPSAKILMKRLRKRGTETPAQLEKRMERYEFEMSQADTYDITVINDDLDETVCEVERIIKDFRNCS
ncbi:guanylate kinase [bacterium]|nr:guanylate kinase [bacterium]